MGASHTIPSLFTPWTLDFLTTIASASSFKSAPAGTTAPTVAT
eukprot:CAMPEP_0175107378 /NCGR_PEP_ID=MMETSP0086_2-20121207/11857_1 /TAXON_ID=136419 /ORGANISM="Unknown Unknown, Strain D1" /LENGTH=42 /DNA_ID= /DNA_START= /DNA_END= /DNA_ORIENTATION=